MRINRVYTRTGDQGTTQLGNGVRVSKTHPRVEAVGTVDELNATIGIVRAFLKDPSLDHRLEQLQHDLFLLGADLITPPGQEVPRVELRHVQALEEEMDRWNDRLEPLQEFILPTGSPPVAFLHLARTVCRRLERTLVHLAESEPLNPQVIPFVNRLSDWLFVLGRVMTHLEKGEETYARFSKKHKNL